MKIIMDVDTGIDDALALSYACGLKEVELIGVMTSFGNVTIDTAVRNTINVLDLFDNTIPVYRGASHPLENEFIMKDIAYRIHGNNGIGDVELGEPKRKEEELNATDFLLESCNKYGKELTLVAVGPLTNLALAISKDKETVSKIGKIVIMGGALTIPGNVSKYAEANIHSDPLAAKIVFESGIPCVVVGLDVTLKTFITDNDIEIWNKHSKASDALYGMTSYYYRNKFDGIRKGGALHDPLALDIAVFPDTCTNYFPINLSAITEGEAKGKIVGSLERLNDKNKSALACLDINSEVFLNRFVSTINNLLERTN